MKRQSGERRPETIDNAERLKQQLFASDAPGEGRPAPRPRDRPLQPGQGPVDPRLFPPVAQAFFARVSPALDHATEQTVATRAGLDLIELGPEQRKLVQNPNAANAAVVARAQVEALRFDTRTAQAVKYDGQMVVGLIGRHDALRQGSMVVMEEFLARTGHALLSVQVDRAVARQQLLAYVEHGVRTLAAEDPARPSFVAAHSHLQAAQSRETDKVQAGRDQIAGARDDARKRAGDAESDLVLAEVLHGLRQGERPDFDKLRRAAERLRELEAPAEPRRAPR